MRRYSYVRQSALGLILLGCGVPDYRIRVKDIPQDTAELVVASYVQGRLATDTPTFKVSGPLAAYTFGLNLPAESADQATISVAARLTDGCLLAVGTLTAVPKAEPVSETELVLVAPDPTPTTAACTAAPPVILAVLRSLNGPLYGLKYSLLLQGWGFEPDATVAIRSTASVLCASGSACNLACPTPCTSGGMGGPGTGTCLTDCAITTVPSDAVHSGPGLILVSLDPTLNNLQAPQLSGAGMVQPIDLLQLLSQPLQITVTNPHQKSTQFQEVALKAAL